MAFVESWVESDPDGSVITGSLLDDYQRQTKRAVRERLEGDPSNPNTGIFVTFTGAVVKPGSARAYAVTFASLGGLTLQDGRIAITTDTNRLYHLKATGVVELAYLVLNTDGTVDSAGYHLNANGTYASAKMYKDATNGLILSGIAGSTYDAVITNGSGSSVLRVLTGTVNASCAGTFSAVNLAASTLVQSPVFLPAGNAAASGLYRGRTGDTITWRNSTNTADINILYTSGAVTHFGAEVEFIFDTAKVGIGSGAFGYPLNVFNGSATGTTYTANKILRVASNASGADATIEFADNTSFNHYISAKSNTFQFTLAGTGVVIMDPTNGLGATAVYTLDDQNQKVTIGRFSAGAPYSYIRIAAASSGGFRMTNAGNTVDVFTIDNSGNAFVAGILKAGSYLDITGSAVAVAAGHLSIGGNTSTTASTFGGGGVTALPAQPAGYLPIFLGATNYKVPYYNA